MKANELMIGDWVRIGNIIAQITGLKKVSNEQQFFSVYYYHTEDKTEEGCFIDDIQPIPLTAEILEKNGWKDVSDHTLKGCETFKLHYEQRSFDFYITIKLRDYFKLESYDDRFYTLCEMEFGCRFVHQLQHALRLCGIEKTIEIMI